MKALERIFLYSVLAILVFYVFLVDNNAESQGAIQEEVRARRIVIVNEAGQEVVKLVNDENSGAVMIYNNSDNLVVIVGADENGGEISVANQSGTPVAGMGSSENGMEMVN
jgi:hypothetical protein